MILLELQLAGPVACGSDPCTPLGLPPCSCGSGFTWIAVEWDLSTYQAIQTAVGNGRVVIEPAGNGAQNLDASAYFDSNGDGVPDTGVNGGHHPFLVGAGGAYVNDSGAIIVGAGSPPSIFGGLDQDRSRICCSNYGGRVDVQGWGWAVHTTGYGDFYNADGSSLNYTATYAGTSAAAGTVAGAAVLLQSAHKIANGAPMSPGSMRAALVASGSAQLPGVTYPFPVTQKIGPRPDASVAILMTLGGCMPLYQTAIGNPGMDFPIRALASFNDGSGTKLYAAGDFLNAGGNPTPASIAQWDGTNWLAVGSSVPTGYAQPVNVLEVLNDGSGPALYVGGGFDILSTGSVSKWDGSNWTLLGTFNGPVYALGFYSNELYAGGQFTDAAGTTVNNIAKWNGSKWSAAGSLASAVKALSVHNDGGGPDLYAGGPGVQRWNGSSWALVGTLLPDVEDLITFDDGTGPALYAGGQLQAADDLWASGVAKWDGSRWWALGDGACANALAVHHDGSGRDLYIGGNCTAAWDLPANYIIKWDGCVCPEDINADRVINVLDLIQLLLCFGQPANPPCDVADVNGDGVVNVLDLIALLLAFGTSCP